VALKDLGPRGGSGPAANLRAITPHATDDLPDGPCRAIWVGGAGNLNLVARGDTDPVPLTAVPAGTMLAIQVRAVRSSGTTATGIVALY